MNPLEQIISILKQYDELSVANQLLDVFAKRSNNLEQYDLLGKLYHDIKDYNKAYSYTKKALAVCPDNSSMYSCRANLAKLLNHMNDPAESLYYLNINDKLTPNNPEVILEKVFALFLLNRKEESESLLRSLKDDVLSSKIEYDERVLDRINFNLGTYDLYAGKFKQGLEGFLLSGKKIGIWKEVNMELPFWNGGIQPDKNILIIAEGGIGDEIINIRFCKQLADYGMNPIWYTTRSDLAQVFNRNGFKTATDIRSIDKENTMWTYSMTLPLFLDLNESQLWDGPYLTALQNDILSPSDKIKIGLKWSGNPLYEQDLHRSLRFDELFNAIKSVDNAPDKFELYSLQRDEGREESYGVQAVNQIPQCLEIWEDTLTTLNSLDIIITSCTSIAHAASALGKRTIILVPITAYYVWASTTDETSIWYGENTTVLRQIKHKCWKEPLARLQQILNSIS